MNRKSNIIKTLFHIVCALTSFHSIFPLALAKTTPEKLFNLKKTEFVDIEQMLWNLENVPGKSLRKDIKDGANREPMKSFYQAILSLRNHDWTKAHQSYEKIRGDTRLSFILQDLYVSHFAQALRYSPASKIASGCTSYLKVQQIAIATYPIALRQPDEEAWIKRIAYLCKTTAAKSTDQKQLWSQYFWSLTKSHTVFSSETSNELDRYAAIVGPPPSETSSQELTQLATDSPFQAPKKNNLEVSAVEFQHHILYQRSLKHRSQNNLNAELDVLTELLQRYPNSGSAPEAQTRILKIVSGNKNNAAINRRMSALQKQFPPTLLYKLANHYWDRADYGKAHVIFKYIQDQHPFAPEADLSAFFEARTLEDQSAWEKARMSYENYIQKRDASPQYARALFKAGFLAYQVGNYTMAKQRLRELMGQATHPNDRGRALYWLAKAEKAVSEKKYRAIQTDIVAHAPLSIYAVMLNLLPTYRLETLKNPTLPAMDQDFFSLVERLIADGMPSRARTLLNDYRAASSSSYDLQYALAYYYHFTKAYSASVSLSYQLLHHTNQTPSMNRELINLIFPRDFESAITQNARQNQIPPELVFALIKQESAYGEKAISSAGAMGLMQVLPQTAAQVAQIKYADFEASLLLESEKNILLGTQYLASLIKRYSGNLAYAVAAYNAGPNAVDVWVRRWGNLPLDAFMELIPYKETRNYVKLVLRNYGFYLYLNGKLKNIEDHIFLSQFSSKA